MILCVFRLCHASAVITKCNWSSDQELENYFELLKMDIFVLKSFILKYLLVYLKQKTAIHSSLAFSEHVMPS